MIPDRQAIADGFAELDRRSEDFFAELEALEPAQLDFRVEPESWSIRDVAQHLLLAEQSILAAARAGKAKTLTKTLRNRFGHLAVKVFLTLGLKVKARIKGLQPQGAMSREDLRDAWRQVRAELAEHISELPDAELGAPLFRHFYAGPLDCRSALGFMRLHFNHHMRQVARIRGHADFPASGGRAVVE